MLLIVGLGNPGAQYQLNRHNIGFMAVDEIHRRNNAFSPWSKKFQAEISDGIINGEKILLIKPQTYMNLSGQSVGEVMRFYKLSLADLVVIYDDLDLSPGKLRIKTGGSSGGHNGIKSIDAHCGNEYKRIRLGIGHPGAKELVHNYVLGNFSKADQAWLTPLLEAIADNATMLAKNQDANFMNKIALNVKGEAPGAKKEKQAPIKAENGPVIGEHKPSSSSASSSSGSPSSGPMAEMLKKLFSKD